MVDDIPINQQLGNTAAPGVLPNDFSQTQNALAQVDALQNSPLPPAKPMDTSGMSGAAQIASKAFTMQPLSPPSMMQMSNQTQSTQQKDVAAIGGIGKSIASGAKNNTLTNFGVTPGDLTYHALFSTTPSSTQRAQIAPIQAAPMQIPQMQVPQIAPAPMAQAAPPAPMPQLAMSDINAKRNIRPVRADINDFLGQVYKNVVAKRKK